MSPLLTPGIDVVLIGGGGHAAVCLDVLRSAGRRVLGYVAREPGDIDLPHLGDDDALLRVDRAEAEVLVAIGDNRTRAGLIDRVVGSGFGLATAISAGAVVSPSARIGRGTVVMPGAIVNARSRVGMGVIINTAASVDHDGEIDDLVHIAPGCRLAGNVTVGRGAFLGVGTSVIPQRTIGEWAIVGAGSVVVRDLPPRRTAFGVPAAAR